MKNSILKLGKALSKSQLTRINGGCDDCCDGAFAVYFEGQWYCTKDEEWAKKMDPFYKER